MAPPSHISSRQYIGDGSDDGGWWYYSETAFIVKWVVTGVVVVGLLLFLVGGYLHAQRRMKKGLPPLRYHRWLVPRRQREQFFPHELRPHYHQTPYGHGAAVPLQNYGPAPPAYVEQDYVPPYAPPEGSSKIDPNQNYTSHAHSGPSQPMPTASSSR